MCGLISSTENYCMTQWVMIIMHYIGVGASMSENTKGKGRILFIIAQFMGKVQSSYSSILSFLLFQMFKLFQVQYPGSAGSRSGLPEHSTEWAYVPNQKLLPLMEHQVLKKMQQKLPFLTPR